MKNRVSKAVFGCVGLALFSLMGCKTLDVPMAEGSLVLKIGEVLPPKARVADGSYVCSRAQLLQKPGLFNMMLSFISPVNVITYKDEKYSAPDSKSKGKSVAIRINSGKVTEIMAVQQGQGETARTYATATTYFSVEGVVWIPSGADLDKVSDFNEAKSMLH